MVAIAIMGIPAITLGKIIREEATEAAAAVAVKNWSARTLMP